DRPPLGRRRHRSHRYSTRSVPRARRGDERPAACGGEVWRFQDVDLGSERLITMNAVLSSLSSRGVLTLTLNRPDRHNALNPGLLTALHAALLDAERDSQVRTIVRSEERRVGTEGR